MKPSDAHVLRLLPTGLRLAPSQVWGTLRLVPILRDTVREDLRFHRRAYDDALSVVRVDGRPASGRGPHYISYVPHGLVMDWDDRGAAVTLGTQLDAPEGSVLARRGPFTVRLLHRMARREDKNRLRLLPLHLAMEGFLSLHFGGPDIAWREYSQDALRHGLAPRIEGSVPGGALPAFAEALRIFELHARQVGVLIFQADLLLSVTLVSHPDDYRRLHRALVEDFYGELMLQYGYLGQVPPLGLDVDEQEIGSVPELRAAITRMREHWADFQGFMAGGLWGAEVHARTVYQAGPFQLRRFITSLRPSEENHLGECIQRDDGTLEYLKTYRLSSAQTKRAYLLQQLSAGDWELERTAARLKTTREELALRLENAGFGHLLRPHVLDAARRQRKSSR
ncbi:ARPP-2 domain-containing protein [Archangium primigenium]|uniref:ARPP-2 domain-containing protein n=1 Tax=[Archangium] primigenium TaxID=2792470 RepID=UPI00195BA53D|nr:hypothetical protein [Archangium primigenium]